MKHLKLEAPVVQLLIQISINKKDLDMPPNPKNMMMIMMMIKYCMQVVLTLDMVRELLMLGMMHQELKWKQCLVPKEPL